MKTHMIPDNISLDENYLPYLKNRKYGYGKKFNAFILPGNPHYHKSTCRHLKDKKKKCIHKYIAIKKYKPCSDCHPNDEIDDWYIEFLKTNFNIDNIEILWADILKINAIDCEMLTYPSEAQLSFPENTMHTNKSTVSQSKQALDISSKAENNRFCKNCGHKFLETSNFCPNCGDPQPTFKDFKKNIFKKIITRIIIITIILGLSAVACYYYNESKEYHSMYNTYYNNYMELKDKSSNKSIVYATPSGNKYHFASCRYLKNKKTTQYTVDNATKYYAPCSVCKPPTKK